MVAHVLTYKVDMIVAVLKGGLVRTVQQVRL